MSDRRYDDPWGKRRKADAYHPDVLHRMLVDDIVRSKPPGGPGLKGAEFIAFACKKISVARKITVDDAWIMVCSEAASLTGRTTVPLA